MRLLIPFAAVLSFGAIVDRIAVVVGKHPVLDSAINRDIRVTSFLNQEPADFSDSSRKKAASRLIDQELIREQIRSGSYPVAAASEANELLAELRKDKFPSDAQYRRALLQAGLTEEELKDRLLWQMTVLRFIDARFRPAVVVSDQEVQSYYAAHRATVKGDLDDARQSIIDQISAEGVNRLLEDWLQEERKQTRIEYLEKSLQ